MLMDHLKWYVIADVPEEDGTRVADLLDNWEQASTFIHGGPSPYTAYEIGDDGEPTGLVLRHDPVAASFLARKKMV